MKLKIPKKKETEEKNELKKDRKIQEKIILLLCLGTAIYTMICGTFTPFESIILMCFCVFLAGSVVIVSLIYDIKKLLKIKGDDKIE